MEYLETLGLLLELQRVLLAELVLGALHVLALVGQLRRVLVGELFFPGELIYILVSGDI